MLAINDVDAKTLNMFMPMKYEANIVVGILLRLEILQEQQISRDTGERCA